MNDAALFDAIVPVFRHYLQRVDALLMKLSKGEETLLQLSLCPTTFSAVEHLDTAPGFVPRTLFLLLGQEVPVLENKVLDRRGLSNLAAMSSLFCKAQLHMNSMGQLLDSFDMEQVKLNWSKTRRHS